MFYPVILSKATLGRELFTSHPYLKNKKTNKKPPPKQYLPKPKGLLAAGPDVGLLLGDDELVALLPVVFVC